MATDFYLTLASNASMEMYPDNTLAHYITDLPQRIDLTGEWECGDTVPAYLVQHRSVRHLGLP